MMIRSNSRGKGIEAKQEDEANENNNNNNKKKAATTTPASTCSASSSRQWSAFRNPRIVRVSRSFGGKDRHSKVCTIRGLRDRRIRLSVPTAIQLYDLQDRLGLTQPSKVIDWLLDATKNDIDNLPPLQMPQGFGQFHHPQLLLPHHESLTPSTHLHSPFLDTNLHHQHHHSLGIKMNSGSCFDEIVRSKANWEAETETETEGSFRGSTTTNNDEINGKGKLIRTNDEEENDENGLSLSVQKLFPLASTNSSLPSFFNINNPPNMALNPYSNYHNWDASNLSLSQFGIVPQPEINNSLSLNTNNTSGGGVSMPMAGAGGSQFFFCPPPVTLPSFFPQYPPPPFAPPPPQLENNETREIGHFQLLNSGFGNSQRNNSGRQPQKDQNADS